MDSKTHRKQVDSESEESFECSGSLWYGVEGQLSGDEVLASKPTSCWGQRLSGSPAIDSIAEFDGETKS